ncbi:MAG TPA: hypothetical protein VFL90_18180 [Methylomirabilota bacterium]|nr:hypothetical protein [Methylomirabilota bacterium]
MSHRCPPARLRDVAGVLAAVRRWPGVVEKKPAIFYVGREPFLHFHLGADGQRRADVKGRAGWASFSLPQPLAAARRRALLSGLRRCYGERRQPRPKSRRVAS